MGGKRRGKIRKKTNLGRNGLYLPGGFQVAVDDEILWRNPFTFEMKEALLNDSVRRETLMNKKYMKFVKNILHILFICPILFL